MSHSLRAVRIALALTTLTALIAAALAIAAPSPSDTEPASAAGRGTEENPNCGDDETQQGCERPGDKARHDNPRDDRDGCLGDGDAGKGNDDRCPAEPRSDTEALVGFGKRTITPVGEPPDEWKKFFHRNPINDVWGEQYTDLDADGCYDRGVKLDTPPKTEGPRDPHVDDPWNSAGDGEAEGLFVVDGVKIYGDPQSAGKWDGVWANAGFGSRCTEGMKDDTWARAIVATVGKETVAMVSLDVVGFFNTEVRRATAELKERYPDIDVDQLVVASTHTHEGVDTMGYWGENFGIDGKFPAYQAFIRSQIIDAVADAYNSREKAFAKFASTEFTVGIRDSRPPHVIDPHLLAAQFVREDGSTIGTVVNWSNHPEAQASGNPLVSSDFPHMTRETLEKDLGGTSIYFSGAVGGLMTPLGTDIPGYGSAVSWERTYELGRLVAVAAEEALAAAPVEGIFDLDSERREFYMDADNNLLRALNVAGVFDLPSYAGGESWGADEDEHRDGVYTHRSGPQFRTEMVAVRLGPASFLTVPGELFPELELGGYGRPECPAADTGRPYEPVITEQFAAEYQFVLGLGQDELGYIVPGYDFWLFPETDDSGDSLLPLGGVEVKKCGEGHYEETVSGSSVMAPWVACVAAELGAKLEGRDPADPWANEPACAYENTHTHPYGVGD